MNPPSTATESAVAILNRIELTLAPLAALNLPLSPADVRVVLELVRDARGPLRQAPAPQGQTKRLSDPILIELNAHLADIVNDTHRVRRALNDEEHRRDGLGPDTIQGHLADASNALDEAYNYIRGI